MTHQYIELKIEELEKRIKALEQEPCECENAVSKQAVIDLIEHYNSDGLGSVFYGYEEGVKFADAVNKLPPVTPQPKTGHWISYAEINGETVEWICSSCRRIKSSTKNKTEYCPVCGAKMVKSEG